ncbi:MAG: ATP-binding cassette domain-containing protein, partial [Clostridia bacterium]
MKTDKAIIEIRDVHFAYPDTRDDAVDGVTMDVREGEFLAVLGHNGSGKSTLAKLMNALFIPASGTVTVDHVSTLDEGREWDVRKTCGMVFQNPDNQLVATIVEEDVAFGLENLGVAPEEIVRRVHEALAVVDMDACAGSAPHMLSGGQKQRVAIAGVLAMRPRVIVFDEATAM